MATEGTFPKTDGDVLYASEMNLIAQNLLVYTGTDLNISGTTTTNTEMSDITFGNTTPDYVNILIDANMIGGSSSAVENPNCSVKIEAKEIGGTYSTLISTTVASGGRYSSETTPSFNHFHTLTSGMKNNGVKYKITTTTNAGTAGSASFTNRSIVFFGSK